MTEPSVLERFQRASATHFAEPLCGQYSIRSVDDDGEWKTIFDRVCTEALAGGRLDDERVVTDDERARYAELEASWVRTKLVHRLVFRDGDEIVGGYWGEQYAFARTYSMCLTGILPAFQRKGIYSAFLPRLLATCRETGFDHVFSLHHANNNAVLIPKLRAGFVISALQVSPYSGIRVELRHYLGSRMRALHDFRIDATRNVVELQRAGIVPSEDSGALRA